VFEGNLIFRASRKVAENLNDSLVGFSISDRQIEVEIVGIWDPVSGPHFVSDT